MRGEVRDWMVREAKVAARSYFAIFFHPATIAAGIILTILWTIFSHNLGVN